MPEIEKEAKRSLLEATMAKLEALYRKFGREGMKDQPLADVQLLLYSKQLALEAGTGRTDAQMEANRLLKLEVQDLTFYVKSQIAALQMPQTMNQLRQSAKPFEFKQKTKERDFER